MKLRKCPPFRFLLLTLCLSLLGTVIRPAAAQEENNGIAITARAGFDGYYKPEFWVPVQVTVANNGPAVEGELRISIGSAAAGDQIIYKNPISLPTQSNKRVTMVVKLIAFTREIQVSLHNQQGDIVGGAVSNRLNQLSSNDLLYGVVSSNPGELSFLENMAGRRSDAAVAFLDMAELPDVTAAWNGLDVLIFNDVDTSQLTAVQLANLESWVSAGGQLVVTGGANWQKTAVALTHLLPVTITGSESAADLPALSQRTGQPFRDPGPYLVTTSSLQNGELLLHQDGLPLLARQSWGRGSVYFMGLDPQLAPLLDWDGGEIVWAEVANRVADLPAWGIGIQNNYSAVTAVSRLPSLALPSVLALALFLFLYVLIVGPVNYFILKRMNRRELAWFTIPALVVLFSGVAYATGFQLKGNETIINQMNVAYGHVGSDQMRVQSVIGLYSPRRATYNLILPGSAAARPFSRNFGGGSGSGNIRGISRGNNLTIEGARVDVSDTETFIADSYQPAPKLSGQAFLNLNSGSVQLDYTLQNNSDIELENAVLLLGTRAMIVGTMKPGEIQSGSVVVGSLPAGSSGASPGGPVFAPVPGRGASPLQMNADIILGTSDYYNDPDVYPRWELLQAVEGDFYRGGGSAGPAVASDVITLIAWSDAAQLDIKVNRIGYGERSTTLYFLEIPMTQNLVGGQDISIPLTLLNWQVAGTNNVYEPSVQNFYLPNGWVDFEFSPWPEFQSMTVTQLSVVLRSQNDPSSQPVPDIRLWDWQSEDWERVNDVGWGETAVADFTPYLGPGNTVKLRVQNSSQIGIEIQEVYPLLTGDLP